MKKKSFSPGIEGIGAQQGWGAGAGAGCFWLLGAGAAWKKNEETEPEPFGKKIKKREPLEKIVGGAGAAKTFAGAGKKFAGSPALVPRIYIFFLQMIICKKNIFMKYFTAQDLDPDYKPPPKKPRVSARLQVPSSAFYFRGFFRVVSSSIFTFGMGEVWFQRIYLCIQKDRKGKVEKREMLKNKEAGKIG